jgi:hypothetical protein
MVAPVLSVFGVGRTAPCSQYGSFLHQHSRVLELLSLGSWVQFTEQFTTAPRLYEKIAGLPPERKHANREQLTRLGLAQPPTLAGIDVIEECIRLAGIPTPGAGTNGHMNGVTGQRPDLRQRPGFAGDAY